MLAAAAALTRIAPSTAGARVGGPTTNLAREAQRLLASNQHFTALQRLPLIQHRATMPARRKQHAVMGQGGSPGLGPRPPPTKAAAYCCGAAPRAVQQRSQPSKPTWCGCGPPAGPTIQGGNPAQEPGCWPCRARVPSAGRRRAAATATRSALVLARTCRDQPPRLAGGCRAGAPRAFPATRPPAPRLLAG